MSFLNRIKSQKVSREVLEKFLILLSPFAPFFCEEQWRRINPTSLSIFQEAWPAFDSRLVQAEEKEIIVQINGRVRDKITVPAGLNEEGVKKTSLDSEKIKKHIRREEIKKVIFIPDRLINFVKRDED